MSAVILESTLTCPQCGHNETETMPTDACLFFYECKGCGVLLKPKKIDCCVFCSYGSAHRRFMEWSEAGVFQAFWQEGLLTYDGLKGLDWSWLSLDGAMTKAPLAGAEKSRAQPYRSRQARRQAQPIDRIVGAAGQPGD
jgi:hypothetical protein